MDLDRLIAQAGVMWQHKREFKAFLQWMLDERVNSVLEIGTGYGGSAFCFGEVITHGRVVTVDFDGAGAARIDPSKRRAQPNPNFVQVIGDSRTDEVQALVQTYAPFDLVYFDTEHAEADVRDNYARYIGMATRFVAQHDINMDEAHWPDAALPRIWRELTQGEICREFIDPDVDHRFPRWGGLGVYAV